MSRREPKADAAFGKLGTRAGARRPERRCPHVEPTVMGLDRR